MCHGACTQAVVDAMTGPTRPTAVVLFIHNGSLGQAHVKVLEEAGLRVSVTRAAAAIAAAKTLQPDIIVLDADYAGDVNAQLQRDSGHATHSGDCAGELNSH
jgi:hypothetical protein